MAPSASFMFVLCLCLGLVASSSVDSTSGHSALVRRSSSAQFPKKIGSNKESQPQSKAPCTTDVAFWDALASASKTKSAKSKPEPMLVERTDQCVDPSTDDPESWACDCSADMESECGGIDEECFQGLMCSHSGVCQEWKDTNCQSLLEMSSKAVFARAKKHQSTERRLDGSVSGKCVV